MNIDVVNLACALSTILQGFVAWLALKDRLGSRVKTFSNSRASIVAALAVFGIIFTVFIGFWVHYHPSAPKIVYVDKPVSIPCPPPLPATRTGNATQKGDGGIANSGTIGTVSQPDPTRRKP